jgi:hypothetical protein
VVFLKFEALRTKKDGICEAGIILSGNDFSCQERVLLCQIMTLEGCYSPFHQKLIFQKAPLSPFFVLS